MIDADKARRFVRENIRRLCAHFYTEGKPVGTEWRCGDVMGKAGNSFAIELEGLKAGLVSDRDGSFSGDFIKALGTKLNVKYPDAVAEIERAFGVSFQRAGTNGHSDTKLKFDWNSLSVLDDGDCKRLSAWRGYSPAFVEYLVEADLVRREDYNGQKRWCFPIVKDGKIQGSHSRPFDGEGWKMWPPKAQGGPGVQAFVVGNLASAQTVNVFESQWDQLAAADKLSLHETDGFASLSTRGASNGQLARVIPDTVREAYIWKQNDQAGATWAVEVAKNLPSNIATKVVATPASHADVNDWTKAGGLPNDLLEAIKAAVPVAIDPLDEPADKAHEGESLEWLKPKLVSELTTVQPDQILRGILYQRCKMVLMGGSKSFKTWTLMDIAYCVANGLLWWGIHTKGCPVIYLDFELLDYDFRWRMEQIAKAHGKGNIDAVRRIGIRGKTLGDKHWAQIHREIVSEGVGLAVSDPTYKLLGPMRDENSAKDIAQVTGIFDRLTEETKASVIYAQHFSKGNQAGKESIDRGAGSGVWARDADAILTMTKHDQEDCLTVEHTLRSFPKINPFVVRWNCPLFERAPELNPEDLKQAGAGRHPTYSVGDIVDCLNGQDLTTSEFQKHVEAETGAKGATFYRLLKTATQQGLVRKSQIDQKWEKVSKR